MSSVNCDVSHPLKKGILFADNCTLVAVPRAVWAQHVVLAMEFLPFWCNSSAPSSPNNTPSFCGVAAGLVRICSVES